MSDNTNPYSNVISPGEAQSQVDAATLDGASLSTDVTLAGDSDTLISSQHAVKTYVDGITDPITDAITIDGSDNVTMAADLNVGTDLDVAGNAVIDGTLTVAGEAMATEKKAKIYAIILG